MEDLNFDREVINFGDVGIDDIQPFTFRVTTGSIDGILPGCPCTTTKLTPDKEGVEGSVNIRSAAGADHPGGPVSKQFFVSADDGVDVYTADDQGNYGLNPAKRLIPLTLKFNLVRPKTAA